MKLEQLQKLLGDDSELLSFLKHNEKVQLWSSSDVSRFLELASAELSLEEVRTEAFAFNGKALLLLKKNDWASRTPAAGDVLFNLFQTLVSAVQTSTPADRHTLENYSLWTIEDEPNIKATDIAAKNLSPHPTIPVALASSSKAECADSAKATISSWPSEKCSPPPSTLPSNSVTSRQISLIEASQTKMLGFGLKASPQQNHATLQERLIQENLQKLQSFMTAAQRQVQPPTLYSNPAVTSPLTLTTTSSEPLAVTVPSLIEAETNDEGGRSRHRHEDTTSAPPFSDVSTLWSFMKRLLDSPRYGRFATWLDRSSFIYRIRDGEGLARLWGQQKHKPNMTYEKMSRALRYYYKTGIMRKVPQQRMVFQFLVDPDHIPRGLPFGRRDRVRSRNPTGSGGADSDRSSPSGGFDEPSASPSDTEPIDDEFQPINVQQNGRPVKSEMLLLNSDGHKEPLSGQHMDTAIVNPEQPPI